MRFFDSSHQKEPLSRLQNPADKQRLPAGKTKLQLILVLAVLCRNKRLNIGRADREESAEKLLGEGFGLSNDLQIEGVKVTAAAASLVALRARYSSSIRCWAADVSASKAAKASCTIGASFG